MKCPICRESNTDVYNTRTTKGGTQVWRRRRCLSCDSTFTTYEQPDLAFVRVQRAVGKPQRYSRAVLFADIYTAFTDSRGETDTIDAVTDTIEAKILDLQIDVVATTQITEIVLATLRHFSMPAFLRYLSSHTDIQGNAALRRELKKYR